MGKRKDTFKKVVSRESTGKGGFHLFPDSTLFKRMDYYFAQESQRWKRIKQK